MKCIVIVDRIDTVKAERADRCERALTGWWWSSLEGGALNEDLQFSGGGDSMVEKKEKLQMVILRVALKEGR